MKEPFKYPRDGEGFALCHHGRRIACAECVDEEEQEQAARAPVPRCETCACWEQFERRLEHGVCGKARAGDGKLWADMYDAIITAIDFGCVQWTAKP